MRGSAMAGIWLKIIDEGIPIARRKWVLSSLVEYRFAPQIRRLWRIFTQRADEVNKRKKSPKRRGLGPPESLAIERGRLIVFGNNALGILRQRLGLRQQL